MHHIRRRTLEIFFHHQGGFHSVSTLAVQCIILSFAPLFSKRLYEHARPQTPHPFWRRYWLLLEIYNQITLGLSQQLSNADGLCNAYINHTKEYTRGEMYANQAKCLCEGGPPPPVRRIEDQEVLTVRALELSWGCLNTTGSTDDGPRKRYCVSCSPCNRSSTVLLG